MRNRPFSFVTFLCLIILIIINLVNIDLLNAYTCQKSKDIERLLEIYDKGKFVAFIMGRRNTNITIEVSGQLQAYSGRPSWEYITRSSLSYDFCKYNLDIDKFDTFAKNKSIEENISQAKKYYKDNEFDKVQRACNEALKFGDSYEAYYLLGLVYFKHNSMAQASQYFEKAAELNPDDSSLYYYIAVSNKRVGNYDKAVNYINQYELNNKILTEEMTQLRGIIYTENGQYEKAIEDFSKIRGVEENRVANYLLRAEAYFQNSQFQKAINDLDIYLKVKETDTDAIRLRNLCYSELKDLDNVPKSFQPASNFDSTNQTHASNLTKQKNHQKRIAKNENNQKINNTTKKDKNKKVKKHNTIKEPKPENDSSGVSYYSKKSFLSAKRIFGQTGYGPVGWGFKPEEVDRHFKVRKTSNSGQAEHYHYAPKWNDITLFKNIGDFEDCDYRYFYFYKGKLYMVKSGVSGPNLPENNSRIKYMIDGMVKKYGKPKSDNREYIGGSDLYIERYITWKFSNLQIFIHIDSSINHRRMWMIYYDPDVVKKIRKISKKVYEEKQKELKRKTKAW